MRVITARHLREFGRTHADAVEALQAWIAEAEAATWQSPHEVQARYPHVSILKNDRLCFNIKGNTYRLIVAISFKRQIILLKFIGTHAEYDKIDAETVNDFSSQ